MLGFKKPVKKPAKKPVKKPKMVKKNKKKGSRKTGKGTKTVQSPGVAVHAANMNKQQVRESQASTPEKKQSKNGQLTTPKRARAKQITKKSNGFNLGDAVVAKWTDGRYYAAYICKVNAGGKSYSVYFYEDQPPSVQEKVLLKDIRVPRDSKTHKRSSDYVGKPFKDKSGDWEVLSVDQSKNVCMCKCTGGRSKECSQTYDLGQAIRLVRQTEKKSKKNVTV